MRIEWNPEQVTAEIEKTAMDRLETAAGYVMALARMNLVTVLKSAPPDVAGKERKEPWKSMSLGTLLRTVRVARLYGDPKQDVRVYAGNRVGGGSMKKGAERGAFYAHIIEMGSVKMGARPFLRPALNAAKKRIMSIMENG